MKLAQRVETAFRNATAGDRDAALTHALIAIDTTAKRLHPALTGNRDRYTRCLRAYYWLLRPMLGGGIDLDQTRFDNVHLSKSTSPDLADILYEVFRCNILHGEELPATFELTLAQGEVSAWELANDSIRMPDRLLWSLLSVAVMAHVNGNERSTGDWHFTVGSDGPFMVADWWGREVDFKPIAQKYDQTKVTLKNLVELRKNAPPP